MAITTNSSTNVNPALPNRTLNIAGLPWKTFQKPEKKMNKCGRVCGKEDATTMSIRDTWTALSTRAIASSGEQTAKLHGKISATWQTGGILNHFPISFGVVGIEIPLKNELKNKHGSAAPPVSIFVIESNQFSTYANTAMPPETSIGRGM